MVYGKVIGGVALVVKSNGEVTGLAQFAYEKEGKRK